MNGRFVDDTFSQIIFNNVIKLTFPKLNNSHQILLHNYLVNLIQFIASAYDFYSDKSNFIAKLQQNNCKDLRWLLLTLLPYIDQSRSPISELKSLEDLYSSRYDKMTDDTKKLISEHKLEDINFCAPKYIFSNLQYGRFNRDNGQYKSIKFNVEHIDDNYYLMLDTIKSTRNKLYINWIDIIPFRLDDYEKSNLYRYTDLRFSHGLLAYVDPVTEFKHDHKSDNFQLSDTKIISFNDKIKGLNIEDIYNVISMDLYESIVTYKWLLFEIAIKINNVPFSVPIVRILNSLTLKDIPDDDWDILHRETQDDIRKEWEIFLRAYESKDKDIIELGESDTVMSNDSVKTFIKALVLFFDRKYNKNSLVRRKGYIPLDDRKIRDDLDDYDENIPNLHLTDDIVLRTAKSIQIEDLYDFIKDNITAFKHTWYAHHMIDYKENKFKPINKSHYIEIPNSVTGRAYVSFKNIYNFAKSFVHQTKSNDSKTNDGWFSDNYVRLPKLWESLSPEQMTLVTDRLNDKQNTDTWFNISRNIRFINNLMGIDNTYADNTVTEIYVKIVINLMKIVFESLIVKGTLSYMVTANDLTNNDMYNLNIDSDKNKFVEEIKKKRFFNGNPYGDNSYYYLTNTTFNKVGKYKIKIDKTAQTYDYFGVCSTTSTAWYLATAYHWIAQLGFCHRFIHNRVTYITGATGAGKSTQVPKLYMYYLKAIDHINDPTVLITVPRVNVATDVSSFVSKELAVPYMEYDNDGNEIMNSNYYVQYKYKEKADSKGKPSSHISDNNIPKLRFTTDGTVIQDSKDPLMKHKKIYNNQFIYSRKNKYDVVIIDEAHEHNTNMDLILTLMKYSTFYNNNLRLVIMSATMDADEPIYRRFYRDINDNRKYPLNRLIKTHNLDRINTDRRFHISPPDQTTRFKIDEYYEENEDPIKIAVRLIKNTTSGDILMFKPGEKEITIAVNELNSNEELPNDVIALPYYTNLPTHVKDFVKGIAQYREILNIDKSTSIKDVPEQILYKNKDKPISRYSRVIVIATNIAEASITINSLRYVIESGLEKTMVFDFKRRDSVLKVNYITEASRVQRKGRVGRVAPGVVYYTYKKGLLENNKKQFNISIQDIHMSVMLGLLCDLNDYPIMTPIINKIVSGIQPGQLSQDNIDIARLIKESYTKMKYSEYRNFIKSIVDIFCDQYLIDGKLYDYYGKNSHYDYKNIEYPSDIYFSGIDSEMLTDTNGRFYIVHPDELDIERNIGGDIIKTDQIAVISKTSPNNWKLKMESNKITVFWESLINAGLVGISNSNRLYCTQLGKLLQYLMTKIQFKNMVLIKMLFYGYGVSRNDDEFENVLSMVTALDLFGNNIKQFFDLSDIQKYKAKYGNTYITRLNEKKIIQNIKTTITNDNKMVKSDYTILMDGIKKSDKLLLDNNLKYNTYKLDIFERKNNMYIDNYSIDGILSGIPSGMTITENALQIRNILIEYIMKDNYDKIIESLKSLTEIFDLLGVDIDQYVEFIKKREELRKIWYDSVLHDVNNINNDNVNYDISLLRKLLENHRDIMNKNNIDMIKGISILSNPYNIYTKIDGTFNTYLPIYSPHPDYLMKLPKSGTLIDEQFKSGYVLPFMTNGETGILGTLLTLNIEDLKIVANVYNNAIRNKLMKNITTKNIHLHLDKYLQDTYGNDNTKNKDPEQKDEKDTKPDYRKYDVPEHLIGIGKLTDTTTKIMSDLEKIQNRDIWIALDNIVKYSGDGKIVNNKYKAYEESLNKN